MTGSAFEQRKERFKDAFERLTQERGVEQDPLMQAWYAGAPPIAVLRGLKPSASPRESKRRRQ